jgi:hypothetical protein
MGPSCEGLAIGGALTGRPALLLAQEMAKALPTNRTWQTRVTVQEAMVRAESLVADARFADALGLPEHGATPSLIRASRRRRHGVRPLPEVSRDPACRP